MKKTGEDKSSGSCLFLFPKRRSQDCPCVVHEDSPGILNTLTCKAGKAMQKPFIDGVISTAL